MARRTKTVMVQGEGRDRGKTFLITEMAARPAERWAMRAFLALGRAGVEIPDELQGAGMAAIAAVGIQAISRMSFEDAEPLLEEMMRCVRIIPDSRRPEFARDLVDYGGDGDDIEEGVTRLLLRSEVFELHTGFSMAGAVLTSLASATETAQASSSDAT